MSNYLAIATVTAGLVQTLEAAVAADVPGATVTTLRPDGSNGGPNIGTNLYLFQVTPNAAWRNVDLPTRSPNADLVQRPRVALDMHYLLTFYGDETRLEPQRVLGSVVRALHERPVLTREIIRNTINANPDLAQSDLADEIELVKVTPIALSLEEMSKLWSVFFQIPYTLSVAYQATVVLIEGTDTPRSVLPVRARNLYVMPFRQPIIEETVREDAADKPIVTGTTLLIKGRNLRGDDTLLRVGGTEVTPAEVTPRRIRLPLDTPPFPEDSLRAGVQGIQVIHRLMLGMPATPHRGFESNVTPFVLRPTLKDVDVDNVLPRPQDTRSANVTVKTDPKIGKKQRVLLLLNNKSEESYAAYTFLAKPRSADTDSLTVPVSEVKPGDYLVRVQVDGAESPLEVSDDPDNPQYIGPEVTIA